MNHAIHRTFRYIVAMLTVTCAAALAGCGGGDVTSGGNNADTTRAKTASSAAAVPDALFLAAAPIDVRPLIEIKESAAVGDEVVFEARIGGSVDPFTESAATFLVADPAIMTCRELHGDGCPTPWDYCCEPKDNVLRNLATIQIVDADGRPLRSSIKGIRGLDPMARVIVMGTVELSDGPTFVVNASGLYVQ